MHNFHGTHNIYSWIESALVEENKVFSLDLFLQGQDLRVVVARCSHVASDLEASTRYDRVQERRDEGDDVIMLSD